MRQASTQLSRNFEFTFRRFRTKNVSQKSTLFVLPSLTSPSFVKSLITLTRWNLWPTLTDVSGGRFELREARSGTLLTWPQGWLGSIGRTLVLSRPAEESLQIFSCLLEDLTDPQWVETFSITIWHLIITNIWAEDQWTFNCLFVTGAVHKLLNAKKGSQGFPLRVISRHMEYGRREWVKIVLRDLWMAQRGI